MEHRDSNLPLQPNAAPRSRLGKGLGALLGARSELAPPAFASTASTASASASPAEPGTPSATEADIRRLPVNRVTANPFQPRRLFDEAALQTLAASLKANGLVQPIVVIRAGDGYQLVAGERRLRAAKLAGLTEIPAIVRTLDVDAQARLALIENIHREDLNPIDRAEGYHALMQQGQLTQQALADIIGDQRTTIANHLRLLDLTESIRDSVRSGRLSFGHAKIIAGLASTQQASVAEQCLAEHWSVRQLEAHLAAEPVSPVNAATSTRRPATPHYDDLAKQLTRALGLRAQVQPSAKKGTGKVTLHYSSLDEFDHLLVHLGIRLND